WIAGPDPRAAEHALTGTVPVDSMASVTLLSDGATRLVDKFGLADWRDVLTALGSSGPDGLIRRVREVEDGDPDGRRWPRGKARDDATVLHWLLS
ncbi:integrase, partial [Streptomyces sp. TRM76130]|nr:integrase [Streptomyces sp. TRM76130]